MATPSELKSDAAWAERWAELDKDPTLMWKSHEAHSFDRFHLALLERVLHSNDLRRLRVVVPMAGDCLFVKSAVVEREIAATAIEFVPRACELLRDRFADTDVRFDAPRTVKDGVVLHSGASPSHAGKVQIFQCSVFEPLAELIGEHDVLYDKDAFGALEPAQRAEYVKLISTYLKPGGTLLLAGAIRHAGLEKGPPFHLSKELVESAWCAGGEFELVGTPIEKQYAHGEGRHDVTYILRKRL